MKTKLIAMLMIVFSGLLTSVPANAEVVGAHVSKIITDHMEPGYASAAILVCAGNSPFFYPEIVVSSEKETKSVIIQRDVPENTCLGETVKIQTDDLSSITAFLKSPTGPIAIDDLTKDSDGIVMMQGLSVDGKTLVEMYSTIPVDGEQSVIKIKFLDIFRNEVQHVNYDIVVKQDGVDVLDDKRSHSHIGVQYHETDKLLSDSPLDIQVTLLGIGMPESESEWTSPQGDVIAFMAVPEFGTVTILVLVATISTVVILGAKSRMQVTP